MTQRVECPALRPSHPLGYLAALGATRLLTDNDHSTVKLSWTNTDTPAAQLHTPRHQDEVIETLAAIWRHQADLGAAGIVEIDGQARALPPHDRLGPRPKGPGMHDPAKLLADTEYPRYLTHEHPASREWARALGTDIVRTADRPTITMSHLYLLSRQQRLDQQLTTLLNLASEAEELLHQALTRWRYRPLQSGMNWDITANRNAAETPTGVADTRIAPGATWLAIMALPLFPVTSHNQRAATRSWRQSQNRPHLLMPCWNRPLDIPAINTLLDHPAIRITASSDGAMSTSHQWELDALDVHHIYACGIVTRRVGGQTERYLGNTHELTPTPDP